MEFDPEPFRGRPPYATELFGIFQPLMGWRSRMIGRRLGGARIDLPELPHAVTIRAGQADDSPVTVLLGRDEVVTVDGGGVLHPGPGGDLFRLDPQAVRFATPAHLDGLIVRLLQGQARAELPAHPVTDTAFWDAFWQERLAPDALNDALRRVVGRLSGPPIFEHLVNGAADDPLLGYVQRLRLEFANRAQAARYLFDREVYLARYLNAQLAAPGGPAAALNPVLLTVVPELSLAVALELLDPLHLAQGAGREAVLSPIGVINLYRQYYFEFENFLGPPVEHLWLSPGSTTELVEVSTRRVLTERLLEQLTETVQHSENTVTTADELSEAVRDENQRNVKLGSTVSGGGTVLIAHVEANASMSIEETQRRAREEIHRSSRQQSAKLASDIRSNVKSTFRTVVETTDTRSKRYTIQNTTDKLVNYELRRKLRRVGVQQQDLGTQLCWQIYVDDPGRDLGVGQLVHLAAKSDLAEYAHQPAKPLPGEHVDTATILLPVPNPGDHSNLGPIAAAASAGFAIGAVPGAVVAVGVEVVLDDLFGGKDKSDSYDINTQSTIHQTYKVNLPAGYQVAAKAQQEEDELFHFGVDGDIPIRKIGNNGRNLLHRMNILNAAEGVFDLVVYGGTVTPAEIVQYQAKIKILPTAATVTAVTAENAAIAEANKDKDIARARKIRQDFVDSVRQRVKLASEVTPRPADELREEERTVIYRTLIGTLMRDAWSLAVDRQVAHLRSELIKSIFDVDRLLYFVAPEWWQPRSHHSAQDFGAGKADPIPGVHTTVDLNDSSRRALADDAARTGFTNAAAARAKLGTLGTEELVGWGGEGRPDNYLITEESRPARLGSSLGWLLQLDGDNLRNAFLNAPWVKAVLPIRPGREADALAWLRQSQVEGADGLDEPYAGDDKEAFAAKYLARHGVAKEVTVADVLDLLAEDIAGKLRASTEVVTEEVPAGAGPAHDVWYLRPDRVFERGFDPLAGGFQATPRSVDGKPAFEVFDQWLEILPTDQIVAVEVEYDPKTGFLK